jgi:hypothetical protein
MTISIKIKGGTLEEGESLCRTCRNAHIQKGFRESEETIICACYTPLRQILFKVAECTDYADRTVPYRSEMEKMALLINVDPVRKRTGFKAGFAAEDEEDSVSVAE